MAQITGKKIKYISRHYENYICMDNYDNRYFIKPETIERILIQALSQHVFKKEKKRTRTWLTIKGVGKKRNRHLPGDCVPTSGF
jgi:hypothetical protein